MALHKDKFEYMCHRHNRRSALVELPFVSELYQYSVSKDKSLAPVGQLRDLGVLVFNDLSWQPHIMTAANKARQKAAWVFSVFQTRSPVIMLTLYKSMVRSLLEYCCPLWHPSKICETSRSLKAYRKLSPQGLLECVISIIGTVFNGYL